MPAPTPETLDPRGAPMHWSGKSLTPNNFDLLRFILAVMVIFMHSFDLALGQRGGDPLTRATGGQVGTGGLAVKFFFVISGFLVTHSWVKSGQLRPFMARRARRIYPAFVVA